MNWQTVPTQSTYGYSDPIVIKTWSGGSLVAKVGYVKQHPDRNTICLEKTWTSQNGVNNQKFNIKNGDWQGIKSAIESLLPEIGEAPTVENIDAAVEKITQEGQLLKLLASYPNLLTQIPDDIDLLTLPSDQKKALSHFLSSGGEIAKSVVAKLAAQPITDIEQFSSLLDDLRLSTINSLTTHVTSRINFIKLFERVILDNSSYERRGPTSVHNLLKSNIWIVDRNYTVLHEDTTLKAIILAEWDRLYAGNEATSRPDFLCMSDRNGQEDGYQKLIIIEIKRPRVKITMDHISQVMRYKSVLQSHSGGGNPKFSCYIVGREIDSDLIANPLSNSGFITKTYTDFIGDARKFYNDYLEILEQDDYAF